MLNAVLEGCESGIVAIPQEVLRKCGFLSHQKVMIKEGKGYFVVRQSLSKKRFDSTTEKVLNRLRVPAGSLAHLADGSGGSGDFDENDID